MQTDASKLVPSFPGSNASRDVFHYLALTHLSPHMDGDSRPVNLSPYEITALSARDAARHEQHAALMGKGRTTAAQLPVGLADTETDGRKASSFGAAHKAKHIAALARGVNAIVLPNDTKATKSPRAAKGANPFHGVLKAHLGGDLGMDDIAPQPRDTWPDDRKIQGRADQGPSLKGGPTH
jgi:hypothetical protein